MKHFKRILATTDLSPESFSAVRYAIHLAKAQGTSLTVAHVLSTPATHYPEFGLAIDLTALLREIEATARKKLDQWVKRNARDLRVRVVVQSGITHEAICRIAEQMDAGLLVMATHGRKGIGHVLLGSVTERVLREAPCPVLVVRPARVAKLQTKLQRKKAA